ncbi:MAG: diacylglycerol kinase [Pirellulaceae bacterium]
MRRHWIEKFRYALRGIRHGSRGQSSFQIHVPAAFLVVTLAAVLRCSLWQFCTLGLCIAMVLGLELVNSSIECLARGLCSERNTDVGQALDIASGAVLVVSAIAAIIGAAVLGTQAFIQLGQLQL